MTSTLPASTAPAYGDAFPNSTKVYLDGPHGIRVPMREIALSGGEPPLRVYDSSGPQGHDVREGLPSVRARWIKGRDVETLPPGPAAPLPPRGGALVPRAMLGTRLRGRGPVTQLHYARGG
ncbi:MAG: phosphomethylpyrimidine synthase ThiC, partial [Gemmatimonadales bacterium]|nr:phosphomethylpyrimidine synthase ThiC [Gemmatimonadales bacterium]